MIAVVSCGHDCIRCTTDRLTTGDADGRTFLFVSSLHIAWYQRRKYIRKIGSSALSSPTPRDLTFHRCQTKVTIQAAPMSAGTGTAAESRSRCTAAGHSDQSRRRARDDDGTVYRHGRESSSYITCFRVLFSSGILIDPDVLWRWQISSPASRW